MEGEVGNASATRQGAPTPGHHRSMVLPLMLSFCLAHHLLLEAPILHLYCRFLFLTNVLRPRVAPR